MLNNFKVDELLNYAIDLNLSIIGVVETWLTKYYICDSEIAIPDFTIYRKDRCVVKDGRGGGVIMYIKNSLLSCACNELNKYKSESIWCKIMCSDNEELYIGTVYRSASADVTELKEIELAFVEAAKHQVLIMGDFNYPSINWDTGTVLSLILLGNFFWI